MELARNIPYSTCSYNDNDSIWVPLESSVEVPSAVNVQSFYSDNQNDFRSTDCKDGVSGSSNTTSILSSEKVLLMSNTESD
jgi:hypothetical protein